MRAIDALTVAGRRRRPTLRQDEQGRWGPDPDRTEPADWAEFVTLALAGAAANLGGIEAALAGRPGSWEADGVRQLLHSTVGVEEEYLWQHRTEPLELTIYVDELLTDIDDETGQLYDAALDEVQRRLQAAIDADPEPDDEPYLWAYDRTDTGEFVARDPEAPAWSWQAWRDQPKPPGSDADPEWEKQVEDSLRAGTSLYSPFPPRSVTAYIAKSRAAIEELWRLADERDARIAAADLEERLAELTTYGEALKARVAELARTVDDLDVPVRITVDVTAFRSSWGRPPVTDDDSLTGRLLNAAIASTPTPAQLPGTPLDRLLSAAAAS